MVQTTFTGFISGGTQALKKCDFILYFIKNIFPQFRFLFCFYKIFFFFEQTEIFVAYIYIFICFKLKEGRIQMSGFFEKSTSSDSRKIVCHRKK